MVRHPLRHFLVRHRGGLREIGGGHAYEREVDLLALLAVAVEDVGIGHHHAVGDEPLQALVHQVLAHLRLELAAVPLHLEDPLEEIAVEPAVLLELGHGRDGGHDVLVAHLQTQAFGLVAQQGVVDELIERLAAQLETLGQGGAAQQHPGTGAAGAASDRRAGAG